MTGMLALLVAEGTILTFSLVLTLMAYAKNSDKLRGLGLPSGSIRSILAIWTVGSYISFLVFAPSAMMPESYQYAVGAFSGIAGAVIGFYFGGRTAISTDSDNNTSEKKKDANNS